MDVNNNEKSEGFFRYSTEEIRKRILESFRICSNLTGELRLYSVNGRFWFDDLFDDLEKEL